MNRLESKRVVVTGAGLGIGRAIAELFAAEGARVLVGTRNARDGEETIRRIGSQGGEGELMVCDIGYREQAQKLVRAADNRFGGLDILVHNAGIFPYAPFSDLSEQVLSDSIDVNLKACFWLSQAALAPLLRGDEGGRILITSSVSGNHANAAGLTHYSAVKAGVTGFVRNLALELAPMQVTVNAIEPGFILTERNSTPEKAQIRDAMAENIPMRRGGSPMDVAQAMLFLASSEASYITGQSIVVDGGLTLGAVSDVDIDSLECAGE